MAIKDSVRVEAIYFTRIKDRIEELRAAGASAPLAESLIDIGSGVLMLYRNIAEQAAQTDAYYTELKNAIAEMREALENEIEALDAKFEALITAIDSSLTDLEARVARNEAGIRELNSLFNSLATALDNTNADLANFAGGLPLPAIGNANEGDVATVVLDQLGDPHLVWAAPSGGSGGADMMYFTIEMDSETGVFYMNFFDGDKTMLTDPDEILEKLLLPGITLYCDADHAYENPIAFHKTDYSTVPEEPGNHYFTFYGASCVGGEFSFFDSCAFYLIFNPNLDYTAEVSGFMTYIDSPFTIFRESGAWTCSESVLLRTLAYDICPDRLDLVFREIFRNSKNIDVISNYTSQGNTFSGLEKITSATVSLTPANNPSLSISSSAVTGSIIWNRNLDAFIFSATP